MNSSDAATSPDGIPVPGAEPGSTISHTGTADPEGRATPTLSASGAVQIFISYRVTPDQRIAVALKRLIEAAIEPQPNVFVSGAGGIRPSSMGAIPQMQDAAETAQAFVGVITQASKAREWIFFEAGAAWGRRRLYAPLLVDTTPDDLPSTIEGYQATNATDRDQMRVLLTELASATGGAVKSHFGSRHAAFERALRDYPDPSIADAEGASTAGDLRKAIHLLLSGRHTDAEECFDALEQKHAAEPTELAEIRVSRVAFDDRLERHAQLVRLEALAREGAVHAELSFWLGSFDARPHQKLIHFEDCLRHGPDAFTRRVATTCLADCMIATGRTDAAVRLLLGAMVDTDRDLQAAAATKLLEHFESSSAPIRLLLATYAFAVAGDEGLRALRLAVELATSNAWHALAVALARRQERATNDGTSSNSAGIVLQAAGLTSLAFMAYEKAALAGVSVAKANMGNLVGTFSVAAAGLRMIEQHTGAFDSASPHYPHRVRATLEEHIHNEKTKAAELEKLGLAAIYRLCECADLALRGPLVDVSIRGHFGTPAGALTAMKDAGGNIVFVPPAGSKASPFVLQSGAPFPNTWIHTESDGVFSIYLGRPEGGWDGARFAMTGAQASTSTASILPLPSAFADHLTALPASVEGAPIPLLPSASSVSGAEGDVDGVAK